jgi:hypothetical protein
MTKFISGYLLVFPGFNSHLSFDKVPKHLAITENEYKESFARYYTNSVMSVLVKEGFVSEYNFERLISSNGFCKNERINLHMILDERNKKNVLNWIEYNITPFSKAINSLFDQCNSKILDIFCRTPLQWYDAMLLDKFEAPHLEIPILLSIVLSNILTKTDSDILKEWIDVISNEKNNSVIFDEVNELFFDIS